MEIWQTLLDSFAYFCFLKQGKFLTTQPLDGMLISDVYAEVESAISSYSTYNEGIKVSKLKYVYIYIYFFEVLD